MLSKRNGYLLLTLVVVVVGFALIKAPTPHISVFSYPTWLAVRTAVSPCEHIVFALLAGSTEDETSLG